MALTEFDMEELRQIMLLELQERNYQLKQCLRKLDNGSPNKEAIMDFIRILHSLKGLFGMTGFPQMSHMFHSMKLFLTTNGNNKIERFIPLMYHLNIELKITCKNLSRKKELNIQGIDKVNQQITLLFL